jgi:signal transduction histidine kinase
MSSPKRKVSRGENHLHEWLRKANSTTDAIVSVFESVAHHLRRGEFEAKQLTTPADFRLTTKPIVKSLIHQLEILQGHLGQRISDKEEILEEVSLQFAASTSRLKELISPESLVEENPVWHDQVLVQAAKTLSTLNELKKGTSLYPREAFRAVRDAALNIERLVCLHELLRMRWMVADLKIETKALSDFLRSGNEEAEHLAEADLANILDMACDAILPMARTMDIEIRREFVHNRLICKTDAQQLLTAIGNILDNAIKYSRSIKADDPKAAWVIVRLLCDDSFARIEIENWGLPITTEEIETGRLFEQGERGDMARISKIAGSGTGLAVVRDIMRNLGGVVTCASRPSRPEYSRTNYKKPFVTTFVLALPRT